MAKLTKLQATLYGQIKASAASKAIASEFTSQLELVAGAALRLTQAVGANPGDLAAATEDGHQKALRAVEIGKMLRVKPGSPPPKAPLAPQKRPRESAE